MKKKLSPEIEAAIVSLYEGVPLGKVISRLQEINRNAAIESYQSGLHSRACAKLHGLSYSHICGLVKRYAPESLRPTGRDGWTKNRAAKAEGRPQ